MESSIGEKSENNFSNLNKTRESICPDKTDLVNLYTTEDVTIHPTATKHLKNNSKNEEINEVNNSTYRRNSFEKNKVHCNEEKLILNINHNNKKDNTSIMQSKSNKSVTEKKKFTKFSKNDLNKVDIYSQIPTTKGDVFQNEQIRMSSTLPSKVRKRKRNFERFRKVNIDYSDLHQTQKLKVLNRTTILIGARRSELIPRSGKVANIIGRFEKCAMQEQSKLKPNYTSRNKNYNK